MPIIFFLFSVAALLFGVVLFATATTVMQEVAAMISFLIFAVFLVGCALAAELSDAHKLIRASLSDE